VEGGYQAVDSTGGRGDTGDCGGWRKLVGDV